MLRKRILAHMIDCVIIMLPMVCFIFMLVLYPALAGSKLFYVFLRISMILAVIGVVLKDCIGKKSIGKRILGLKVININGTNPRYYQLILRNVLAVFWFIEAFILVFLDRPRLGDQLANTKVICN